MVRSFDELAATYCDHNSIPKLDYLLTGTSPVPQDRFTQHTGDSITITTDDIVSERPEGVVVSFDSPARNDRTRPPIRFQVMGPR
jgi:hypothetical protein